MPLTSPLVQAAVGLCATVGLILTARAVDIWKHRSATAKRTDEIEEKTEELVDQSLRQLWKLIFAGYVALPNEKLETDGGVVVETMAEYDEDHFVQEMREQLDAHERREISFQWRNVEPLEESLDRALKKYRRAYQQVALSALGILSLGGLIIAVAVSGSDPFGRAWEIAHAVIGILSAASLYQGIINFNEAESLKDEIF